MSSATRVVAGGAPATSLDIGTKLVPPCSVRVFPTAREASWYVRPSLRSGGKPGRPEQPSFEAAGRQEVDDRASRRAAAQVRRYCKANRLSRHLTVTFDPEHEVHSRGEVLRAVAAFRRRLFEHYGERFPFVGVPEQGGKNRRWHCEVALGRYVPQALLESLWGNGFVNVVRYTDRHKTGDEVAAAAKVAGYLSKYVAKAFAETERQPGDHRYEVAQGFQPESEVYDVDDLDEGYRVALRSFGGELPAWLWSSADVVGFEGLPVRCGYW